MFWGGSRRLQSGKSGEPVTAEPRTPWAPVSLDVTRDDSVAKALADLVAQEGRLDGLVHCAGISVAVFAADGATVAAQAARLEGVSRVLQIDDAAHAHPLAATLAGEATAAGREVPIFMAHGLHDPLVPLGRATRSRDLLRTAGLCGRLQPRCRQPRGHGHGERWPGLLGERRGSAAGGAGGAG